MTTPIKTPKKLIEVALPLDDINIASAREKSIRHGHPSTLHLWWARRPLAAARAVIFAQMVNDPGYERSLGRGVNKEKARAERERLFGIIRKLVLWENSNNADVLAEANSEIWKSWRETCELNRTHPKAALLFNPNVLPSFHDPFAGGGALPLEAQRLGLESHATDLNPVAVLINKAMIEIPPRFTGVRPVGPLFDTDRQASFEQNWIGTAGLSEDVRRYGAWVLNEAKLRIGKFYPKADLPPEYGSGKATVIAWIWTRTVKSPNPAYSHVDVPLVSSFVLSSKSGKSGQSTYVAPIVTGDRYEFRIRTGIAPEQSFLGTTAGKRNAFLCLLSGTPIDYKYIRAEGKAGRIGQKLMAIVAEVKPGRVYLEPTAEMEKLALNAHPTWKPETVLPDNPRDFKTPNYGMTTFGDIFTSRQLVALSTFSELIQEVMGRVAVDAVAKGMADDGVSLEEGGAGALAYSGAIGVYLSFVLSKMADRGSSLTRWMPLRDSMYNTFARQALPMTWDFVEVNALGEQTGGFAESLRWTVGSLEVVGSAIRGFVNTDDASTQSVSDLKVVSTVPPYYDNIGYADLSDFFYVWLRRALKPVYPSLFSTLAVPKNEELVATPYRHGGKEQAEAFFLSGMTKAMNRLAVQVHPAFPTTIYYAFKQSDTTDLGTGNTGWETFLEAVLRAGFSITGTWPMRTELSNRMIGSGTNALASSIVLVCRPRALDAPTISRRDFIRELKEELKEAVEVMIGGTEGISPVAPVDLAQAVIGPGMAIFSKYSRVLEADGMPMSVHTALTLINRMLTDGAEDFDADTQFCLAWFDEQGWAAGEFGQSDVLARAKGTSVSGVKEAGVIEAGAGKVRLLRPTEYPTEWSPIDDNRTPVWEALHQMIRVLRAFGEGESGKLLAGMPQRAEPIRNLAYRLYSLCERKGWAEDARTYNELITSWTGIEAASHEKGHLGSQTKFDI